MWTTDLHSIRRARSPVASKRFNDGAQGCDSRANTELTESGTNGESAKDTHPHICYKEIPYKYIILRTTPLPPLPLPHLPNHLHRPLPRSRPYPPYSHPDPVWNSLPHLPPLMVVRWTVPSQTHRRRRPQPERVSLAQVRPSLDDAHRSSPLAG